MKAQANCSLLIVKKEDWQITIAVLGKKILFMGMHCDIISPRKGDDDNLRLMRLKEMRVVAGQVGMGQRRLNQTRLLRSGLNSEAASRPTGAAVGAKGQ